MRISDWSSDVCSSDLEAGATQAQRAPGQGQAEARQRGGPQAGSLRPRHRGDRRHRERARRGGEGLGLDGQADPEAAQARLQRKLPRLPQLRTAIGGSASPQAPRSEEHTSELQSLMRISYAVFCLKKKNTQTHNHQNDSQYKTTN